MQTECQRINTSRSFLTVLIISRKSTVMDQSLTPWSLKNCSPIDPQSLPGLLNLWCWTSSLPHMSKTWTLLQIYTVLILFPLRWINLQKIWSLKIHQSDLAAPTHQTFCLLWGFQRDLLVHIPPHKGKTWFLCFWQTMVYWKGLLGRRRKYTWRPAHHSSLKTNLKNIRVTHLIVRRSWTTFPKLNAHRPEKLLTQSIVDWD